MQPSAPTSALPSPETVQGRRLQDAKDQRDSRALLARLDLYQAATYGLVTLGIVLRLREYLYDRSLWLDESLLTLNLLDKSFTSLFGGLSFNQAAPPGFLLVERVDVDLFGSSEYALRLFPLICGIASVVLFARFANQILPRASALLALALFSVAEGPVYYSSEVKQYSTDVAITLLIMVMGLEVLTRKPSSRRLVVFALVGALAVWFSHTAVFAVGAVAVVMLATVAARTRLRFWPQALVVGTWSASLIVALAYERSTVSHTLSSLTGGASTGLLGPGGVTFPTGATFVRNVAGALLDLLGVSSSGWEQVARFALSALGIVGGIAIARRSVSTLALLAVPAIGLAVASELRVYPVLPRTILFLLPYFVILVAAGTVAAAGWIPVRRTAVALAAAAVVLAVPVTTAARHAVAPVQREETKPVLRHLLAEWRDGDSLYTFFRAQYPLRYYLECGCFLPRRVGEIAPLFTPVEQPGRAQYAPALRSRSPRAVIDEPRRSLESYVTRARPLAGRRRVWVLATGADPVQRSLLGYLSCVGTRKDAFVRDAGARPFNLAAVYLYDLSPWSPTASRTCNGRFGL
jgi:hypothetical protein